MISDLIKSPLENSLRLGCRYLTGRFSQISGVRGTENVKMDTGVFNPTDHY